MNQAASISENPDALEALFDSFAQRPAELASVSADVEEEAAPAPPDGIASGAEKLLHRVGQMTRTLHESLRALGYDKVIEKTAAAIPDARDRLAYVITMTEQAAERTMNAADAIKPVQERLEGDAARLSGQWDRLFARELDIDGFKALVAQTRGFLGEIPAQTSVVNAQLLEIMMAQDFQDLTGQVIKKTTEIIQTLERELLQLLLENIPLERRPDAAKSLINGPVINAEGRADVVTSQSQVDDLLESLGF